MSSTSTSSARKPATPRVARTRSASPKAAAQRPAAPTAAFDLRALLEKAKLPSIDVDRLIDASRRDIDAVLEANAQAYRGLEALNRRQAEILATTLKQVRAGAKEFMAEEGVAHKAGKANQLAQRALGQALAHMKEVAEAAAQAQQGVLQVLKKRQQERVATLQKQVAARH